MIPCYCLNCSSRLLQVDKVEHCSENGEDDLSYRAYMCQNCKMSYELQPTYNELGDKSYVILMDNWYVKNGGLN